jgi:hypothetical protein
MFSRGSCWRHKTNGFKWRFVHRVRRHICVARAGGARRGAACFMAINGAGDNMAA